MISKFFWSCYGALFQGYPLLAIDKLTIKKHMLFLHVYMLRTSHLPGCQWQVNTSVGISKAKHSGGHWHPHGGGPATPCNVWESSYQKNKENQHDETQYWRKTHMK